MDADTKFRIDMAYRYLGIPPGHHVRVNPDTDRDVRMAGPELFQDRKVIDIDLYPQGCRFLQFLN